MFYVLVCSLRVNKEKVIFLPQNVFQSLQSDKYGNNNHQIKMLVGNQQLKLE